MERKKISDKVKIIAVVTAVLVAAAALATFFALTANSTETTSAAAAKRNSPVAYNGDVAAQSAAVEKTQLSDPVLEFTDPKVLAGTASYDPDPSHDGYEGLAKIDGQYIDFDVVEYVVEGTEIDDASKSVSGITYSSEMRSFTIKNAGNYTVKMRIVNPDTHEWANANNLDANGDKIIGSFTVSQAVLGGEWSVGSTPQFEYSHYLNANKISEELQFNPTLADGANLDVTVKYYSDGACQNEIAGDFPLGYFYAKVVAIVAKNSDDRSFANYRLPDNSDTLRKRCNVKCGNISEPTLDGGNFDFEITVNTANKTITAPYKGTKSGYYTVTQFIGPNSWKTNYDSGKNLVIKVDGEIIEAENLDSVVMNDVKTYTISFAPAEKFGWGGNVNNNYAVEYKLTVEPVLIFGANTHATWVHEYTYTGEEISLDNCYTLKFGDNAVFEGDSFEFVIDKTQYSMATQGWDEEGNPIITGYAPILRARDDYEILITGLTGESAHKYVLPTASGEHFPDGKGFKVNIKVLKKTILQNGVQTEVTADWNGVDPVTVSVKDILLRYEMAAYAEAEGITMLALVADCVAIECTYPNGTKDSVNHGASLAYGENGDIVFTYSKAGSYTLTFQINGTSTLGANYTFPNGQNRYVWNNFAVIDPLVIDPIVMDQEYRSILKGDDYKDIRAHVDALLTSALGANRSFVSIEGFGDRNSDKFNATQSVIDCVNGKHVEGEYYVLLKLSDSVYPHSMYFKENVENEFEILDDGTAKIYYVVSSNVVNIVHSVTDYSFGDDVSLSDVISRVSSTIDQSKLGETTYKFYFDEEMTNELAASDLFNGVPRNAGVYYIQATVVINDPEIESPWVNERAYVLTVSPRALTLKWSVDGTVVDASTYSLQYNADFHAVTASINPSSLVEGATDVSVTVAGSVNLLNSNTYSWKADDITVTGADASNYTLNGGNNVSFALTITRIAVTISASDISLVYGQTLTEQTLNSNASIISGSFIGNEHENGAKITVYIYKDGVRYQDLANLPRGNSLLVPVWLEGDFVLPELTEGQYEKTLDNYVVTMKTATLSLQAQELKIRFTGNKGESVYGDDPVLTASNIVEYVSGLIGRDSFDEVVRLTAKKGEEVLSSTSSAGKYTVYAELADEFKESYRIVTEGAETGVEKYEVKPRSITVSFSGAEHIYGTPAAATTGRIDELTTIEGGLLNENDIVISARAYTATGTAANALSTASVGEKFYISATIDGKSPSGSGRVKPFTELSKNGNYSVTVIPGEITVVPRPFNIAFTGNGSAEYGEALEDMYLPKVADTPLNECTQYKLFDLLSPSSNLPILNGKYLRYPVKDMVAFKLVDKNGTEYDFTETLPAGEYSIKPVAGSSNFTVGQVSGTESFGKITVTPRKITVEVSSTSTSVVYGNAWTGSLDYNVLSGSILEGDDLGVTLGIFDSSNEQVTNISMQNVGDYYAGLKWTNSNYEVEYNELTIKVLHRAVQITPDNVTSHTYGENFDVNGITWSVTSSNGLGKPVLDGDNLYVTANVYDGNGIVTNFTSLPVKEGGYVIRLTTGENANKNYTVTLDEGTFNVDKRAITVTPQNVANHAYGSGWKNGDKYSELKYEITSELKIVNGDDLHIELFVYDGDSDVTNNVTNLTAGDYEIRVTASNDNYDITLKTAKFTVGTLKVIVTFLNAGSVYGENVDLSSAYSVSFADSSNGTFDDYSAVTVSALKNGVSASNTAPVGEYLVTVTLASNYEVQEYVGWTHDSNKGSYVISQRIVTVTPDAISRVYGNVFNADDLSWQATTSNGTGLAVVNEDNLGITLGVFKGTTDITSSIASQNVGQYDIKVDASRANANYDVKVNSAKFTVTQATVTIAAKPVSVTYGNALTLAEKWYTASSADTAQTTVDAYLAANSVTYDTNYNATVSANTEGITVTPVCASSANVKIVVTSAAVTVNKREITLNFTADGASSVYGETVNLYSADVGSLAANGLVNSHTYQNVVSLTASNNGTAMENPAAVGQYVVTASVNAAYKNNYTLKTNGTGKYEVTEASFTIGSVPDYNGQYDGRTHESVINVTAVNNLPYLISYITRTEQVSGGISALDWTNATSQLVTPSTVSTTYVYYRVTADNHASAYGVYSIRITKRQVTLDLSLNISSVTYGETLINGWYGYKVISDNGFVGNDESSFNFAANVYDGEQKVTDSVSSLPVRTYNVKLDYTQNSNYTVTVNELTLNVVQRIINVTFGDSGTSVYGSEPNLYSAVTFSGLQSGATTDDYKALVILTAVNGDSVEASSTAPIGDYSVTARLADTHNYSLNYTNEAQSGGYRITARPITVTFTDNGASSIYGDPFDISGSDVFSYECDFVNGHGIYDIITVSAEDEAGVAMAQTNPHAGIYVVKAALKNSNYEIVYGNGESGAYTVTKRVITAVNETPQMQFVPLTGEDYVTAMGAYGAAHNVKLTFQNIIGEISASDYGVVYNTVSNGAQAAGAAPVKAGDYVATVKLNENGNYAFGYENGVAALQTSFDFTVTTIKLVTTDFFWKTKVVSIEASSGTSSNNVMEKFDNVIMTAEINRRFGDDSVIAVPPAYNADRQLFINVSGSSSVYTAKIALRADAAINYEFADGSEFIVSEFTLTNSAIVTSVVQQNWQYSDTLQRPSFTITIGDAQYNTTESGSLVYLYGVVSKDKYENAKQLIESKGEGFNGFDISSPEISALYSVLVNESDVNFDVGYYVVCVSYSGAVQNGDLSEMVAVRGCDVFEVEKKRLASPVIGQSTFNGSEQSPKITYENVNGVDIGTLVTTSSWTRKNAGGYDVEFSIKDKTRYAWDANGKDSVTVRWTILSDNADNSAGKYFTVGTIENVIYGNENIILPAHETKVEGYDSTFVWYFASKKGASTVENVAEWTEWTSESKPRNAGDYWVVLVMKDAHGGNFSPKYSALSFTVNKASLTVTPTGTLTYGQKFSDGEYTYEFSNGFKYDDDKTNVVFKGEVTYSLVDTAQNLDKLQVKQGGYALSANSTLTADNYEIKTSTGTLTVNARKVTVTISGVSNRQYGWEIDLSSVKAISDDEFATAEVVENVIKSEYLSVNATAESVVGNGYRIKSSYSNPNFEIKYNEGVYEIVARNLHVTMDASNAGGEYKGTIGEVTISSITDDAGADVSALVNKANYLSVTYGGTAFDGSAYDGANTHAGNFTATATGDANNANFKIVNAPTVNFAVTKIVLNSSNISTKSQMYTGGELTPDIVDEHYNVNGERLYNVEYVASELVDATTHKITLALTDGHNYVWNSLDNENTTVLIDFVIASAGIYAIPYGSVQYGNPAAGNLNYKLVYASNGNPVSEDDYEVTGEVIFEFVGITDQSKLNKLEVGEYNVTLKTENGFVVGLKSKNPNYNVALERNAQNAIVYGTFEVTPRKITIQPVTSTSVYSQEVIISNEFTLVEGTWAPDEDKTVITYTPNCTATAGSPAGPYVVTATAGGNKNYEVTVNDGEHVITPIIVYVEVTADNGVYADANRTAQIRFNNVRGNVDLGEFTNDLFAYTVTGRANNGTEFASNDKRMPTDAGSYSVTLSGISSGNYKLDDSAVKTCEFAVDKKVIDQDAINARENVIYNGEEQHHGIEAVENEYTVSGGVYKDAQTYTVTLSLADRFNLSWKNTDDVDVTKQYVIGKAVLTLIPNGTLIYGQAFDGNNSSFSYELTGFKGQDDVTVVNKVSNVVYKLVNENERLVVNNTGYALTVEQDNGFVKGLSAQNYNIVVGTGTLFISKRDITIRPEASSSIYTQSVVLSKRFEVIGEGFVEGDNESAIWDYVAQTAATSQSAAGEYDVTATASSNNYRVNVLVGKHTIEKIKVGVAIRAVDGVYGDDSVGGVSYVRAVATNLDNAPINGLTFKFLYKGTANDGTVVNSTTLPQLAGLYEVKVDGVTNANYVIDFDYRDGIPTTMIEIARRAVDAREIVAASAEYTGSSIRPVITDSLNQANVYDVDYGNEYEYGFVEVGSYAITLTLKDVNNYVWLNNLNPYDTITFTIVKANNALVDENGQVTPNAKVEISDWSIDGQASKPQVRLLNGSADDVVFEYSTDENGSFTTEVPVNAGTYWVRATMPASSNYNAFVSKAVSFVINKRIINVPTVKNPVENSVYSGEMQSLEIDGFDDRVMSLTCDLFTKNANGVLTLSALNAGKYTATLSLRNAQNYVWDNPTRLVDGNVVINWTIERKVLSKLPNAENKILVNGEDITFIPEGFNSGIMTITGNVRAHKGQYSAVVTLKDTANYAWEGTTGDSIAVDFELTGTNVAFIASMCVVAGLCVGLAVMAVILTLVNRRKRRKQAQAIDERSRADGWTE